MPDWPSNMLYDSAKMIMIPICDNSPMEKRLEKPSGASSITSAAMAQMA